MSGYPLGTPVMNLAGTVMNPATSQNSDGSVVSAALDRQGGVLVTHFHGRNYVKAARGNLFVGSSGAAGVSLAAAGGTTAGFVLYNPASSGILVELEKVRITTATAATAVIAGLALEGSAQVPSAVTAAGVTAAPLGAAKGAPLALCYKAATITAMSFITGIGINIQATTYGPTVGEWDADGTIVLAPGFSLNLVSTISQSTDKLVVDFVWSEWLA